MKTKKIGVDYIGITCVFYCHDGKGNFLLHKRSKDCKDEQGRWDVGGGALEFGEEFEQGVRREVREEYCTEILDLKFVGVTNVLRTNSKGEPTHWIALIYAALIDPEQVKNGEPKKIEEIGWFAPENFPEPRHSMLDYHYTLVKEVI